VSNYSLRVRRIKRERDKSNMGYHWFFSLLFLSFWLQICAIFIWLKTSQLSREILRVKVGGGMRNDLIRWSNFLTGVVGVDFANCVGDWK